ncbi:hypothetical protein HEP_00096000, partial [Hepatocystis sp. ex Piliocolobus tephrosceles]
MKKFLTNRNNVKILSCNFNYHLCFTYDSNNNNNSCSKSYGCTSGHIATPNSDNSDR